jgi:signal transduction histidine kinase
MKKPTVLILADDEESLGSFRETLQKPEFSVVHHLLVEATARLAEVSPDLVMVVIGSEEQPAFDACKSLKNNDEHENVPVLMTGEERHRPAAFNCGATGYIAIPIDSTELMVRVRAEIERKRLQELATFGRKQMDPSLQMMVHDLKNVLTVIETNLELMEMKKFQDCEQSVQMSRHNCRVLFYLIQDLSDIRNLQTGEMNLAISEIDVAELIHSCTSAFADSINYRKGNLEVEVGEMPPVRADRELIYHVLFNLMANAMRNTKRGGSVTISCKNQNGMAILAVADEGDPIPEALRERMFDEMLFADTGFQAGKGMGLTFCRLAAEGHGGSIRYKSEGKKGNQIILELPLESRS